MDEQQLPNTQTHDGVTLATPPTPQQKVGGYDMDAPIGKGPNGKKVGKESVFDVTKAFTNPHNEVGVIVSDKRKTGPTVGQGLASAFREWWAGTENEPPRTPAAPLQSTPQPKKTSAVTRAELEREVMVPRPAMVATPKITPMPKVTVAPTPTQKEVPAPSVPVHEEKVPEHDHIQLEKIRTLKSDILRARHQFAESNEPATPQVETKKEEVKIVQPKAHLLGPLTVPDVRTATIAPLVTERTEVPPEALVPPAVKEKAVEEPVQIERVPVPMKTPRSFPEVKKSSWWKSAPQEPSAVPPPHREAPLPPAPVEKYVAPEPSEEHTPLPTVEVGTPVLEATQVRMPSMVFREPVKHDELFPQKEEIVDILPSEDEVLVEKKLEFRSTIDTSALEERKRQVQKQEQPATSSEGILSRFSIAPWTILLGVVLLGAVLAIATSVSINLFTAEDEPVTEVVVPSFFETEAQNKILVSNDRNLLLMTLTELVRSAKPGVTQFYPIIQEGVVERPATAEEFFMSLDTRLSSSALRTLDAGFMIGSVTTSENEPYLILQSNDFDTLFSALLAWESSMRDDLAPLFGTVIPPEDPFTDTVENNKSVRILRSGDGKSLLLYSFINQSTVVITKSEEALSILLEKF